MEHELETAFCEDSTRQFIFGIDEALFNFLNQKKDEEFTFEAMNSYQRKLVHLIVQHYQISSRSIEEKSNKETNQEENKSGDPLKKVKVNKTKDSKCPMLKLKDYLTRSQQLKHDGMQKGFFRNTNSQDKQKSEEEKVIFKGRGKARWRPEDYGNYRFEDDRMPTTLTPKKEQYVEKRVAQEEREASDGNVNKEVISENPSQDSNEKIKPVSKEESQKKETRTKMLSMINGILGGNRNPRKEEDNPANSQIIHSRPKENTQVEKEDGWRSKNSQKCSQQGIRKQESAPKPDNFLPSTNHILVIYEVIEGLSTVDIEDIIQKNFNIKASARLQETIPQGVLVFESEMDADKVFRADQQLKAFKLAKFARDDNKILSEAFAREYFNVANLRPKANKSAAIRMINGHLKFK